MSKGNQSRWPLALVSTVSTSREKSNNILNNNTYDSMGEGGGGVSAKAHWHSKKISQYKQRHKLVPSTETLHTWQLSVHVKLTLCEMVHVDMTRV